MTDTLAVSSSTLGAFQGGAMARWGAREQCEITGKESQSLSSTALGTVQLQSWRTDSAAQFTQHTRTSGGDTTCGGFFYDPR